MKRRTLLLIALGIILATSLGTYAVKKVIAYRNYRTLVEYGKFPNPRQYAELLPAFETHPEERAQKLEKLTSTPFLAIRREDLFFRTLLRSPLPMPESVEDRDAFKKTNMFHGLHAEVKEVNSTYAILLVEGKYLVAGYMPIHRTEVSFRNNIETDIKVSPVKVGDSGYLIFELKEDRFGWNLISRAH